MQINGTQIAGGIKIEGHFGKPAVSDKIPYDTVITYLGIDPSEMRTCSLPNLYVSIAALFSHQLK